MEKIFSRKSGRGNPVVLIHGYCETHEVWANIVSFLSDEFEVYTIDLPGFGNSPLPEKPFSIANIGHIVLQWMKEAGLKKPIVIGHSLGGYVTLAMVTQEESFFCAVGLFHSTAFPDTEERKVNRNKVIEFVRSHGSAPFIDTFVPSLFYRKDHPAVSAVYQIAIKTLSATIVAYAAAMRDRPAYIETLKNFGGEFLLLGGDQDMSIPADIMHEMSILAKRPTLKILTQTGHAGMFENIEEAGKTVAQFCRQVCTIG